MLSLWKVDSTECVFLGSARFYKVDFVFWLQVRSCVLFSVVCSDWRFVQFTYTVRVFSWNFAIFLMN